MDNAAAETAPAKKSWISRVLDTAFKGILRTAAKLLYGIEIQGGEHFKGLEGKPTLIVANHVSYLDAVMLALMLPVKPAFAIAKSQHEYWSKIPGVKSLMARFQLFPIDSASPQGLKDMTRLVQKGAPVMIFPEGFLTRTGTLMQLFDGAAAIAEAAKAQIVPVHLQGFEFLKGMTPSLKSFPKRWFPKLNITVGAPRRLDIPEGLPLNEKKAARAQQLRTLVHEIPLLSQSSDQTLMSALRVASRNFGRNARVLDDVEEKGMTYGTLIAGAYALSAKLRPLTEPGETIGVLLPNSRGAAATFFALQAGGQVAAMLNAKAGPATLESCAQTAQLKTVLTSRRFVAMGKLEKEIAALEKTCKIVYLDDIKPTIGRFDKLKAYARMRGWIAPPKGAASGTDPAVVLFTSGSEGVPKGVVLSSQNFLANVAQTKSVVPFTPDDKVFNAMPLFHAFGLTGGLIMPLLSGVPSYQYPTPLDGKIIPKAVYFNDATIMFGTDTFLNLYAKSATPDDFARVKLIFAGAERLKQETYNTYVDRFGVRINQGYGMTEAAPVVAINTRSAHKQGTVGRFVPGMEQRLEDMPGIDTGKRLYVRGPNVMLGYLKNDKPGVIQPLEGGWHDTGDIVAVDAEGFVSIAGRVKRFAKIGGEMVALDAVETMAGAASTKKDAEHAVVLQQDPDAGDSLALFTTDPELKREQIVKTAQASQRSILGLPRDKDIHVVETLPKLPTGKTDYVTLGKMLKGDFARAAAGPVTASALPQVTAEISRPAEP